MSLTFPWHSPALREVRGGTQEEPGDRNLGKGLERRCLLAWTTRLAQSAFYTTQVHLPRGDTTHSGLCPPTSIIN